MKLRFQHSRAAGRRFGRDVALRCPRPAFSGAERLDERTRSARSVPSPDASLGDGDSAARRPYREQSDANDNEMLSRSKSTPATYGRGFTLIEIMVVVVILGILAATIIPQFMGTTHDAKVSKAKSDVSELENALERFYIHMDRHPTTEEGLKVLVSAPPGDEGKWRGPYVKQLRDDPWGHPYQYRNPGIHHTSSFDLWSKDPEKEGSDIGNW